MTRIDHLSDPAAALSAVVDEVRALRTQNPLANASMSSGLTRILVDGTPVAAIGHASGRAGFLIASGGGYIRVQEWVDQQVAAGLAAVDEDTTWLSQQVSGLGGRMGTVEAGQTWLGQQVGALSSGLSGVDGRLGTAESGLDWLSGRNAAHEGRLGTAEAGLSWVSGRSTAHDGSITTLTNRATAITNMVYALIDAFADLEAKVREFHPTKPYQPPPVKG